MKIVAWSDGHGTLPIIKEPADVMVIAGDISPLYEQNNMDYMLDWFKTTFINYVADAPVEKVILVAGNHDFMFDYFHYETIKKIIEKNDKVRNKLAYLEDELYEYNGIRFYGCPWCSGPLHWAFSPTKWSDMEHIHEKYDAIVDCDVLITHQPPKVKYLGASTFSDGYVKDFGSNELAKDINKKDIRYNICGHIHTGTHGGVENEGKIFYNVSLKDEDYKDVYEPTYIEI